MLDLSKNIMDVAMDIGPVRDSRLIRLTQYYI